MAILVLLKNLANIRKNQQTGVSNPQPKRLAKVETAGSSPVYRSQENSVITASRTSGSRYFYAFGKEVSPAKCLAIETAGKNITTAC